MDTDLAQARATAFAFLARHKTGVLTTATTSGKPSARLLFYVCDDDFNIYFSTLSTTKKYSELKANAAASFVVATEDVPQTVQIEGKVLEITEGEKAVEGMAKLIDTLMSNATFYWPLLKLHTGEVVIMKLIPESIRWADYAFGDSGNGTIFKELMAIS